MLVLTRKVGESIVIDDEIVLKVSAIQGNRIKLSLEAPRSRRILRGEVAQEIAAASRTGESSWKSTAAEPRDDAGLTLAK
jgi:carbon storage regulator